MIAKVQLLAALFGSASAASSGKPHLIFMLADDYGFADVAYHTEMYGHSANVIQTPNLDRLSAAGVRLENYYVQPVCSPTRATIMTGRYVIHTGIHTAFSDSVPNVLPIEEVTVAQHLKAAGYATHMVGKWHLGFMTWEHTPTERGFDSHLGYYAGSTDYFTQESLCWPDQQCFTSSTPTHEPVSGWDLHSGRDVIENSSTYSTTLYTVEAARVMAEHAKAKSKDQPLFLYLPYQAVHVGNKVTPSHPEYGMNQAPLRYIEPYLEVDTGTGPCGNKPPGKEGDMCPLAVAQRRNLSGMVAALDEAAGNITASLERTGLWSNSLFVFSTDNGGPLNGMASNYPLRGGKASIWEGGLRGIGFVTAGDPARLGLQNPGSVNHAMIHISDWLPTLCDKALGDCDLSGAAAGALKGLPLDGVSAWGAIARGEPSKRTEIVHDIWQIPGPDADVVDDDDVEDDDAMPAGIRWAALRMGDMKLLQGSGATSWELYNISADVRESTNLFGQSSVKAEQEALLARMAYWTKESAHVKDQNLLQFDKRSNPFLNKQQAWLPWCPDGGCAPPPPAEGQGQ